MSKLFPLQKQELRQNTTRLEVFLINKCVLFCNSLDFNVNGFTIFGTRIHIILNIMIILKSGSSYFQDSNGMSLAIAILFSDL